MDLFASKENIVLTSGFLVVLFFIGIAMAQTNYDEIRVQVNISEATILDVNPNETSWWGLAIGAASSNTSFVVENIGSRAITTVDANITFNTTTPYGSSDAGSYDSGNFIIMNTSNQTDGKFYYINKRDWNETAAAYLTPPTGWSDGSDDAFSTFVKFKTAVPGIGGMDIFMFTNVTAAGDCTDGDLYISNHRHTRAETGDIDFTNTGNYTSFALTASGGYGWANISMPGNETDFYCARVAADCTTVDFFHFNAGIDDATEATCINEIYPLTGGLNPGSSFTIYLQARIPYGVAAGTAAPGTVSLIASPS